MTYTKMFWGRSDKSKVLDQESFEHHYNLIKYGCGQRYTYDELKKYSEGSGDYDFSIITTKLNIFGLIQFDESNKLVCNHFFRNFEEKDFFSKYSEYYLSYWQVNIDNGFYVKPYFLLLDVLKRLKEKKNEESYLTIYEFKKLFHTYTEITDNLVDEIISFRKEKGSEIIDNDLGTLGYSSRGYFKHSMLLNFEFSGEKRRNKYFVELKDSNLFDKKINQLLSSQISKDFYISHNTHLSGREKLRKDSSDWGKFLNNEDRFKGWFILKSLIDFKEYCSGKGFHFKEDLIRRFILSLETKPFLILTGISGSGKTKIAELYGDFLNENTRGEKFILAIGSNWNDNKKLLGFQNPLQSDPELVYQKTDFVEFIKKANENLDKIYIVILDEMNLSYTEKYFADFLSALESLSNEIMLPNGEVIQWSKNLKIIGTINEDETTHTISPKVLDRANVIEMNGMLPSLYIQSQIDKGIELYINFSTEFDIDTYKTILDSIYDALNGNFAFRIINEVTTYLLTNKQYDNDLTLDELLDEQIYQKILPKVHGSKMDLPKKLTDLKKVVDSRDYEYINTNEKIKKMLDHVSTHGYASFIVG